MRSTNRMSSAADLKVHLDGLNAERALADFAGLGTNGLYMESLRDELAITRSAYVAAAVTEIAILRGTLSGRLQG